MGSSSFLPILASLALTTLSAAADPSLTIYNQNFAVVRDTVPLDLKDGINDVSFTDTTARLEPDSVILRDPAGQVDLQILEQNYRNDPVSQELLLSLFEGKTIDFAIKQDGQLDKIVQGKIVRSGYVLQSPNSNGAPGQPIIEVDGKLQFGLPGQPLFPTLGDDTILKPTLQWKLQASGAAKLDAELAYVTEGMSWHADYNVVSAADSDLIDIVGWITMDNQTGKTFSHAKIKLMAGDVNKIQNSIGYAAGDLPNMSGSLRAAPAVTEKAFEDYHLYSLPFPTDLRDGETKQVEFIHASNVKSDRIYVYDGGGADSTKVAIMREFQNSEVNHLGMPLPKGRLRFYKKDDQALEFTGENTIDHTPQDETIKVHTGDAFDLVGERTQTSSRVNNDRNWADESYSITLRNHKKEAVEIRVVEHLNRWNNWTLSNNTKPFTKTNAQEIEFRVPVPAGQENTVSYKVHYSW